MFKLLKADFRRYSRTRLLYIVALINLALSLLTILITYFVIDELLLGGLGQKGYDYFLTALNPSSNGGLLIGIVVSAVVAQEFAYGTIRNKIIVGHRRFHVYLSLLLSTLTVAMILFIINMLTLGLLATFFFGYGRAWNAEECLRLLALFGLGSMIYLFFALMAFLFGTIIRNQGGAIIGYIFGVFFLSLTLTLHGLQSQYPQFVETFFYIQPFGQMYTLMGDGLNGKLATFILISIPLYYLLVGGLGYYIFNKRDL